MLFFALEVLLVVLALISCLSAETDEVRALPRFVWIIVILLFPLIGSITYFAVGRPLKAAAREGHTRPGSGFPEATRRRRPPAPDDDPEFLRSIEARSKKKEDEELLRRWEEDLRRREGELRKPEDTPPTDG
jgi:hypothetical protein